MPTGSLFRKIISLCWVYLIPDFSVSERDTADVLGSCERPLSYLFEISWICLGIVCVPRKSWDKPFMNIELVPPCGVENGINRTCPTIFSSHRKHWTDLTTLFVFYVDCLSYATRISGKTSKTSLRCDIPRLLSDGFARHRANFDQVYRH